MVLLVFLFWNQFLINLGCDVDEEEGKEKVVDMHGAAVGSVDGSTKSADAVMLQSCQ